MGTSSEEALADMRNRLARRGFNLTGIVDSRRFDAEVPGGRRLGDILPGARSAMVIAAGGRALWDAISEERRKRGEEASATADPIDRFSEETIREEAGRLRRAFPDARFIATFPFKDAQEPLSYLSLAERAGLGTTDTVLRLLLHPVYGPWVSLRGCLITDLALPISEPLREFHPCEGCARPCLTPCPVTALTPAGWDHAACMSHRTAGPNCLDGCAPRLACPVGQEHAYGPEEMRHRQMAALP
ncbi:MAG: hypothetical protein V3U86_12215 [Acidobacteriota bacterium]